MRLLTSPIACILILHGAIAQNDLLLGQTIGVTGAVRNIAAFDANTLVAITATSGESIPLRSVDGGQSWRAITLTVINKSINCFAAADATTAVGVGAGGRIVRTTDAGATWDEMPSPTTLAITNVFFTDTSTGFATCLGAKYLTTTNAGASWTLHSLGSFFNDLFCMQWLTPDVGFAAGNGIFATIDGGDTWTLRSNAVSNVRAMHFRNNLEGFVGTPYGWSTTTNGGSLWTAQSDGVAMESIQVLNSNAIYVSDATNMWLSTDEGVSWQPYYTAPENITAFRFANTSNAWYASGSKHFRTVNAGLDWQPAISNPPVLDYLYWKAYEQDSLIYLTGHTNYMLRSKDLGLSWDTVNYAVPLNAQATGLDFHNASSGYWHSSNSQLYYFTDTGRVANLLGPNGNNGHIVSFDSLHVLKCDLFTGSTAVFSINGASAFNPVPWTNGSKGIHKVDAQYGFVIDASGEVRRTSDGGQSYTLMGSSYSGQKSVYFADALQGLVFDDNITAPELSISNDGGTSWANITAPIAGNRLIRQAYRLNTTDILLLMSDGTTYFSHDMGASFDPVLSGYDTKFRHGCLTNGHFYLFGYTFAIRDPVFADNSTEVPSASREQFDVLPVSPNPTRDLLHLGLEATQRIEAVEVIDARGSVALRSGHPIGNTIDLRELQAGVYCVLVRTEEGILTARVVRE